MNKLIFTPLLFLVLIPAFAEVLVPNQTEYGDGVRLYIVANVVTEPTQLDFVIGQKIDFQNGIRNTGTVPLTDVTVTSVLQDNLLSFTSDECTIIDKNITCLSPDLEVGGSLVFLNWQVIIGEEIGRVVRSESKLCGTWNNTAYCATDRAAMLVVESEPEPIVCPDGYDIIDGVCVFIDIIPPEPIPEHSHDLINQRLDSLEEGKHFLDWIDVLLKGLYDLLGVRYG